eukprot:COSAG06_NODE_3298_length_5538_cov_3.853833_2_plen_79_part_00
MKLYSIEHGEDPVVSSHSLQMIQILGLFGCAGGQLQLLLSSTVSESHQTSKRQRVISSNPYRPTRCLTKLLTRSSHML